ncbi:MAG TPA: hypothetical protein VNT92_05665 [Acidimicrobiia bacterium]|nr:hypothetical protein [Acidimicrobiia bacterium]
MREQLNSNPLVQLAVVAVLLVGAAFFVLSSSGGGEEEESAATEATVSVAGTDASGSATGAAPGEAVEGAIEAAGEAATAPGSVPALPPGAAAAAPPPPRAVTEAFDANRTVALLFVRNGGIDDRLVKQAVGSLQTLPDVATFVVPAGRISRYAAIAQGVAVDRVPALVVLRPKRLGKSIPTASVSYGFQSPQSVVQAVVDAGYKGRTLDYHP